MDAEVKVPKKRMVSIALHAFALPFLFFLFVLFGLFALTRSACAHCAVHTDGIHRRHAGGYATCEKTRGWHFFEWFNASEVFGEIMIDYDYVECTSSALQALCHFREMYPKHRTAEVNNAVAEATKYMLSIQLADGSWEGMWGQWSKQTIPLSNRESARGH